ncbi:MAG TPA: hypothetical protein VGM42_00160, partial [Rhodopila sp.]
MQIPKVGKSSSFPDLAILGKFAFHPVSSKSRWLPAPATKIPPNQSELRGDEIRRVPAWAFCRYGDDRAAAGAWNMGGSERPYFQASIVQLEAMFDRNQSDIQTIEALDNELSFRIAERAARLRAKVAGELAAVSVRRAAVGSVGGVSTSLERSTAVIASPCVSGATSSTAQADASVRAASPSTLDLGELSTVA